MTFAGTTELQPPTLFKKICTNKVFRSFKVLAMQIKNLDFNTSLKS